MIDSNEFEHFPAKGSSARVDKSPQIKTLEHFPDSIETGNALERNFYDKVGTGFSHAAPASPNVDLICRSVASPGNGLAQPDRHGRYR